MNQFSTILKFELKNCFQKKAFVGITIFLVLVIAFVMFSPRVFGMTSDDDTQSSESKPVILVVADSPKNADVLKKSFAKAFADYDVKISEKNLIDVKNQIISQKAECAFVLKSLSSYEYYVNNLSLYDSNTQIADEALENIYRMDEMEKNGVPMENVEKVFNTSIEHDTKALGQNQAQNFFYTYIMIFALYFVIIIYGQMVATNVATEKSSRAMELLITSAKPVSMMFGKIIASCLAGLIQLVAVFGSAYLFYNINKPYWTGNPLIESIFNMPLELLVYMVIFFILGFFIYAFLYGAIGSTVSKLEDINTAVMPLTLIFVIAFFVVVYSMTNGSVDNIMMVVCSYIPFTSPVAMFTRIAMSTVPFYEILISIAILVASVIGIGVISAKIYRVGVLLYGTTPKIGSLLKAIKKA